MIRAVVIGGGHGGLIAADKLARAGCAVTVVERSPSFGGVNRRLDTAGRCGLPAACYSALGLEPGSPLRRTLWPADDPLDPAPERLAVCDHVFLPEGDLALPGDLEGFFATLEALHPAEAGALASLAGDLRRVCDSVHDVVALGAAARRPEAWATLRRFGALRYRDYLRELIADLGLRRLLCVRAFASGNTASTLLAYLGKILRDGLYKWPGSGAAVTERLLARLAAHGGRCVLRPDFEVAEVLFDNRQRAAGVRSAAGEVLPAGEVLLGIGVPELCRRLIGPPDVRAAIEKGMADAPSGLSALVAVFAMRPEFSAVAGRFRQTARIFWCEALDPYEVLDRREQGALDLSYLKINVEHEGEAPIVYAEIDCTASAAPFAALAGREERELAPVLEGIEARLERVFPGFAGQVAGRGLLTPRHYAELSGNPEGTASGWRDDVRKPLTLDRTLERYGLTVVGQWSLFGSGLSQLELSAHLAAQAVRRRAVKGEV